MPRNGKQNRQLADLVSKVDKLTAQQRKSGGTKGRNRARNSKSQRVNTGLSEVSSEYLAGLVYPTLGQHRPTDFTAIKTTTVTLTHDLTMSSWVDPLKQNLLCLTLGGSNQVYQTSGIDSSTGTINLGAVVDMPGTANFKTLFSASRIISASIEAEFIGNASNDGGQIYTASYLQGANFTEPQPTNISSLRSGRDNATFALRDGAYVRFKPFDSRCFDFLDAGVGGPVARLYLMINGINQVTNDVRVRLTVNIEAIPKVDTLSYATASDSPTDATGFEYVKRILSEIPSAVSWNSVKKIANTVGTMGTSNEGRMIASIAKDIITTYGARRRG